MTASQADVGMGGNSAATCRSSVPGAFSGMPVALLHHFHQIAEGRFLGRFRVHEKHLRAARTVARSGIDHFEALLFHIVEGLLDIPHAKRDMRESTLAAALLKLLRDGRIGAERLEQLDQIRPVAHLQQHLADLVFSEHVFTMHFRESKALIGVHILFQFALLHRNGDMVEEQESGNLFNVFHYSNSTTTCPFCTPSPALTFTLETLPSMGAVIFVSIFIASRTSRMSPVWMLCPGCAATFTTTPEMGLRHTFASLTAPPPPCEGAGAEAAAGTRTAAGSTTYPRGGAETTSGSAASTSTS